MVKLLKLGWRDSEDGPPTGPGPVWEGKAGNPPANPPKAPKDANDADWPAAVNCGGSSPIVDWRAESGSEMELVESRPYWLKEL